MKYSLRLLSIHLASMEHKFYTYLSKMGSEYTHRGVGDREGQRERDVDRWIKIERESKGEFRKMCFTLKTIFTLILLIFPLSLSLLLFLILNLFRAVVREGLCIFVSILVEKSLFLCLANFSRHKSFHVQFEI